MEDFGHIDLSMDLNLNLSPPSPPPQLGLGLGLSSAPLGHDDFYSQIPGLICPRFEPLISSSGFGDLEPTFVQQAAADAGRESGSSGDRALPAPGQSHFASGNSRYRWRRIRTTSAGSRAAAFPHVAVVCSEAAAEPQKERHLESEEISKPAEANQCANFECNICLEMAGEPVVTLCGHLFCWPCLYQWLNVHSSSNECPVCKGEVTEKNITPIYGRGVVPTAREHDEGRMAVPPRPHAHRVESSRHRRRVSRPFSRRVEEIIRLRNGNRSAESSEGPQVQEGERVEDMIGAVSDQIVHRLRFAQRLQRGNPEDRWRLRERIIGRRSRLRSPTATDPHVMIDEVEGRMSGGLEGDEIFRDMPFGRRQRADRLAAIRTRLASMEGMLQTLTSSNPHPVASVPFQLSAASGVLVIPEYRPAEGVVGHPVLDDNTSGHGILQEELRGGGNVLEQGSVRSAHAQSRRDVQSGGAASGSLDVDGGLLHARKIRRIN